MIQIKTGIGEQTEDPNEIILLTNDNNRVTILDETEEQNKKLNNTAKIV